MPELGESVHEGTVSRWLKKVGDTVKEDEPIVEIMTDKVNTELPSPASGILVKILIPEGNPVEVFHAMGIIAEAGEEFVEGEHSEPAPLNAVEGPHGQASLAERKPSDIPTPFGDGPRWYSPVVRSIAKEQGISDEDLARIRGTGSGGRVTKKDLVAFLAGPRGGSKAVSVTPSVDPKAVPPSVAGPDQELVPLVGMRKMIADAMVRSAAVPTVSTVTQIDVTAMVSFRERNKDSFPETYGVKLTYTPFFIKALTEALLEFPLVNASLQPDNQILLNKGVHMGVAVSLGAKGDEGLIVPVIRDCHKKSLIDLAKELDGIAAKARSNQLTVADVQGGTFTLTNPGSYGALFGTPMINAPQAGIGGAYAIQKVPVIVDDMIAIRSVMYFVLTYDHRIIDGLVAGRFLQSLKQKLEKFEFFR